MLLLEPGCRKAEQPSPAPSAERAVSGVPVASGTKLASPAEAAQEKAEQKRPTTLLYVRIPKAITPLERAERYETPLDTLLREQDLGEVSGGGSALKAGGGIEYVGIDVDVYDAKLALPIVIKKLRELGVPKGTIVEETRDDDPAVSHPVW